MHGGDYNPDQWPPDTVDDDLRLMGLSRCNTQTLAIFSWARMEPEEGRFDFGWLDAVMDKLAGEGYGAVLATPSAAPPAWMSNKYPEILRVGADRVRRLHGNRVNNCWTSPTYREKCRIMAQRLAERYKDHPALLVWHLYNEYGGDCHCDLCQDAFREWLKAKFDHDLVRLNQEYWTGFWGHAYTDWEQIESPGGPYGETSVHGLSLDWRRFTTWNTIEFMKNEIAVLKSATPDMPVTTNMMGTFSGLDYWKFVPELDVVSWDNYPFFHDRPGDWKIAADNAFVHDIYRTFKGGRPWMLMESTPSSTNWMPVSKLKRPGMHQLLSLQAVAHGSDTVQYFQWRQSRGGSEKFHGAVVAHNGDEHTRVFRDVAEVGEALEKLQPVIGSTVKPEVAIIYDWENNWAIEGSAGPIQRHKNYTGACQAQYRPFWGRGVPADVINADGDFSPYRLLVAPMLYMIRPGVAERLEAFVRGGGTFVTTYWSGIANENDLVFQGGFPGPLRKLLGIWSEEIDALYEEETVAVLANEDGPLGLNGEYAARQLCDLIHPEGAETLATYGSQFYAGRAALTVNSFGEGRAYYIASRNDDRFTDDFYGGLIRELGLKRNLDADLPQGVTVQRRSGGEADYLFVMNFTPEEQTLALNEAGLTDVLSGAEVGASLVLPGYGSTVLRRTSS
jgi:beta-galactosidase